MFYSNTILLKTKGHFGERVWIFPKWKFTKEMFLCVTFPSEWPLATQILSLQELPASSCFKDYFFFFQCHQVNDFLVRSSHQHSHRLGRYSTVPVALQSAISRNFLGVKLNFRNSWGLPLSSVMSIPFPPSPQDRNFSSIGDFSEIRLNIFQ